MTVVNAAHHATRVDGSIPDLGDPDKSRVFTNDKGWTISLSDGFVVTAAARLETCDGDQVEVELPFGPFPEYWTAQDKNSVNFGSVDLPEGTYCKLIVEYGRYQKSVADEAFDTPFPVKNLERVEGRTIYLAGYADRPDGMGGYVTKNFGFYSDQTVQVALDISKINLVGGPFQITGDEVATPNITVLKAYDAFFQGIDFDALDEAAVNERLPAILTASTGIVQGTAVH
ncbi:MAG: hypothetical protein JNL82_19325 [Myxococcales bacterium]|nr:hypothetical protein [Myxococcales bacterium]